MSTPCNDSARTRSGPGLDTDRSSKELILKLVIDDFLNQNTATSSKRSQIASSNSKINVLASAKLILKVVRNALLNCTDTDMNSEMNIERNGCQNKKDRIRLSNPVIQSRIVTVPYGMDLLTGIGFVYYKGNDEHTDTSSANNKDKDKDTDADTYLIFQKTEENITNGNLFCWLFEERLDAWNKIHNVDHFQSNANHIVNNANKNDNQNTHPLKEQKPTPTKDEFLSEKERKERSLKVSRAKKKKLRDQELVRERWLEDKADRCEKLKRKERIKAIQNKKGDAGGRNAALVGSDVDLDKRFESSIDGHNKFSSDSRSGANTLEELRARAADAWQKRQKLKQSENQQASNVKMDTSDAESEVSVDSEVNKSEIEAGEESMQVYDENENEGNHMDIDSAATASSTAKKSLSTEMQAVSPASTEDAEKGVGNEIKPSWETFLEHFPRCAPANGIRDTSVFYSANKRDAAASSTGITSKKCFKRIFTELRDLETSLPTNKVCSAWLRFDEETPQYMRAMLSAPLPGPSPYAGGMFAFDIFIPDDYPNVPPKVHIATTGMGTMRFGPNLYACGKVCLSILGTWSGPKWHPKSSSLLQILVSIQSLLLGVEHPFYLEPGYGGWENKVKEGDFASVGNTLTGEVVKEDLTLPHQAWVYEDKIRVGTVRYAMLEPLEIVLMGNTKAKVKPSLLHLLPFIDILRAHFYHNSNGILSSVAAWIHSSRPSTLTPMHPSADPVSKRQQRKVDPSPYPPEYVASLKKGFHKLELKLCKMNAPNFAENLLGMDKAWVSAGLKEDASYITEHPKSTNFKTSATISTPMKLAPTVGESEKTSDSEILRSKMQEAAKNGNFILAGQLQHEIQSIEAYEQQMTDLKTQIDISANQGDYINAGKLQAKLKCLEDGNTKSISEYFGDNGLTANPQDEEDQNMHSVEEPEYNDSDSDDHDGDGSDSDDDHAMHYTSMYGKEQDWGTGLRLDGASHPPLTVTQSSNKSKQKGEEGINAKASCTLRLPVETSCRLRIRLPDTSIVEEFDGNEKLAVVYKIVKTHIPSEREKNIVHSRLVQLKGYSNSDGSQKIGLSGGTFASPMSEYGFTLISAHPKREYSLEMDGLTSLQDLGMVPSTTLSVMMCSSRGLVKRGALESKLAGAQGDAMEIEDLGYEALQELGEKIGVVAPGDGAWKGIDDTALAKISTLISPNEFLSKKSAALEDSKCPICLGEFDINETTRNLRQFNSCSHIFHSACLQTWLATKNNCPVCKQSLS